MVVLPSPVFFFLICSISLPLHLTVAQEVNYRAYSCTYNSTYEPRRALAFQANLNSTLLHLNSNSTISGGFYNTSCGNGNYSETAYGSFLCRGDISPELCRICIRETSKDIINRCPNHKEAFIWYDECMLRFSNRSMFSRLQQSPGFCLWNLYDVSTQLTDQFNKSVNQLMNRLVSRAVSSEKLYAAEDVNVTVFDRLYGLVQCTPDITPYECNRCLSRCVQDIPGCCSGKRGGRLIFPSCSIRFESEPFYNQPLPPPPAAAPAPPSSLHFDDNEANSLRKILAISLPIATILVILLSTFCWFCWNSRRKHDVANQENAGDQKFQVESLQFELSTIQAATNNFSDANKIGEGGYGPVYQGSLRDGQKIAAKRLSQSSGQGEQEFKNEVEVLVKLQHRNLVRLLGFCLDGEEKILIYEYVPNKSLNYFLFDPEKQMQVDWPMRIMIIDGVARGLLYLHEDSRLRIIHRDLKASNVLLDENMNPKISDFGMARIFMVDQSQENTKIIAGTFGYMSPEYAFHGQYSVKSDVFSFGVLVLEIISSKRNTSYFDSDNSEEGLLSYAWRNWKEGSAIEVAQPGLSTSCPEHEVTRCIHVALLCVQEDPTERPTMETVVLMLSSLSVSLPLPKRPGFSETVPKRPTTQSESNQSQSTSASVNEASITEPYPR